MMNANAHFTIHRDARWLYRMSLICLVLGGGIVAGWHIGDGKDWFFRNGEVRYFVVPICHVLLLASPLFAFAGRNNKLPALMLSDTALLYRTNIWSTNYRGVKRDAVRRVTIHDNRVHGNVVGRTLLVHVADLSTAFLPGSAPSRAALSMNQKILGAGIAIPCAGWPVAPEEVKAHIEAWATHRG